MIVEQLTESLCLSFNFIEMEMANVNIQSDSNMFESYNDQRGLQHNNSMSLPEKKEFNRVAVVNIPHDFLSKKFKSKQQRYRFSVYRFSIKTIQNDNNLSMHYLNRRMLALDRDK